MMSKGRTRVMSPIMTGLILIGLGVMMAFFPRERWPVHDPVVGWICLVVGWVVLVARITTFVWVRRK